jgi:apolipoprotein D and lipocalin family protein
MLMKTRPKISGAKTFRNILFPVVLTLCACAGPEKSDVPVETIPALDLQRYAGIWYEIASFPMFFQHQYVSNTKAKYTIGQDDKVNVHNECKTRTGIDTADGIAELVPGSNGARLRVSFFRPFWADYWVIGLAPDYGWAVVGNPNRRYLWILSRSPKLPQDQLDAALASARKQGYDLQRLQYTPQVLPKTP